MKDYQLSKGNLSDFFNLIQDELGKDPVILVTTQTANTGNWGMARLWRVWMDTTAKEMARLGATMPLVIDANGNNYGVRPFDKNDAHELFTNKWLGVDKDGFRLSWAKKEHDGMRPANREERFYALQRHEVWCVEKGIQVLMPRNSEYDKLTRKMDQ